MTEKVPPMAWKLQIDAPVNSRSRRATVIITDDNGQTLVTDRADLTSIRERRELVKRVRIHLQNRKLATRGLAPELDQAWAALVDKLRTQETDRSPTDESTVFDRVQYLLANEGAAAIYSNEQLLRELAKLQVENPIGYAAIHEMFREKKASVRDLDKALHPLTLEIREAARQASPDQENAIPYRETPLGIFWERSTQAGSAEIQLTNFTAKIVADVAQDDGAEVQRYFEIASRLKGRTTRFLVPADRFAVMNWPTENLGATAIVFPGLSLRDHARCAIQVLSRDVPERLVIAHLGWRKQGQEWIYVHAGGAVGRVGRVSNIQVSLPESLSRYELPEPPAGDELRAAIRASHRLLDLAKARISFPLCCAVPRAILESADFSLFLVGPTHEGKTELAARLQQHWGSAMDARSMPASWSSTSNALEVLAHTAKDAAMVVDDFVPSGSHTDAARQHRDADRLLRGQGNRSGRQRLGRDSSLRPEKYPRGLIVGTGEDLPRGQSLRGRMLVLEVGPGDVDWSQMTAAQTDGANGEYSKAVAGFLQWLAPRYEEMCDWLRKRVEELRCVAARSGMHRRTPFIVAHLFAGWELWLRYAIEVGAVSEAEAAVLKKNCWSAFGKTAAAQQQHQAAAEPTQRFLELVSSAVASGRAHVAAPEGDTPKDSPESWGWREVSLGTGEFAREEWRPQGELVGWVDGTDLYIEPDAAYAVVQVLGRDGGEVLGVSLSTLKRRLNEKKLLKSTDPARDVVTVRRTLSGWRREVLHLSAIVLAQCSSDQPDQPDQTGRNGTAGSEPRSNVRPPQNGSATGFASPRSGWSGFSDKDQPTQHDSSNSDAPLNPHSTSPTSPDNHMSPGLQEGEI